MRTYSFSFHKVLSALILAGACLLAGTAVSAADIPSALPSAELPSLPDYGASDAYSRSYGSLPESYDSRKLGLITPVRNQNPWGTCWAFGALGAGEASLIKKGLADPSVDLSELHLSYFFFHAPTDPLGNTKNDSVSLPATAANYLESGGNNLFTMFELASWAGAASETIAPYETASTVPSLNSSLAYEDTAHLQNARFVSTADLNSVKKLIMEYGAVSSAFYYDSRYLSTSSSYYYPKVASYNNHIVTLVGWDDNYATYHFNEGSRPSAPGAWIAKNSHGTSFGDGGYFYISYEDKTLNNRKDALSYAFDLEKADNYDHNYQYDGSFGASTLNLDNGECLANIFTVSGNPSGREQLKAISFALYTPDVYYSIQVYKNPDPGEPESGTAMFSSKQYGSTTYSGYYTIPLKTQPVFQEGDTFSVVLTFRGKNQSYVDTFVDYTSNTAGIQFQSSATAGQSFYKSSGTWKDMTRIGNKSAVARIKAFTKDTAAAATPGTGSGSSGTVNISTPRIRTYRCPGYNSVYLSWTSVSGATGYKIYRSTSPNGTYTRLLNTRRTSFTDTKRRTGTNYYYRIRAYKTSGSTTIHSGYSNTVRVRVIPATPSIKKIRLANNKKNLLITWNAVNGATGYSIYRSTSKNGTYRRIKIITSGRILSYLTNLPKKGSAYYYKVQAYRTVNNKRVCGYSSSPKGYYRQK